MCSRMKSLHMVNAGAWNQTPTVKHFPGENKSAFNNLGKVKIWILLKKKKSKQI